MHILLGFVTMTEPIAMMIDGEFAGVLQSSGASHVLEYDDGYRAASTATPLSTRFPLLQRRHGGPELTNWLWGLLPENALVLDRWAREFRASASDPMSLLSTPVGRDCAGAVQFVPMDELEELRTRGGSVQWLNAEDLATIVDELRRDASAWLGTRSHRGQFSIAGAQSKIGLRLEGDRWGLPSGMEATTHILKPGVEDAGGGTRLADQALNEHLCMQALRHLGIPAARSRIMSIGSANAIVVERFDRALIDAGIVRIHQEDLCQAIGVLPSGKYESDGGPGIVRIAEVLHDAIAPRSEARSATMRFAEALAFNWLIGGTDAHAKNYSLLLSGNQVRLAPLYDVASSLPYWHLKQIRLAMKLDGDDRVWPWRNRWPAVAGQLRLDPDELVERVRDLAQRTPDAFEQAAAELDGDLRELPVVSRLLDEVAAQCARCATLLDATGESPGT
jgi:serine/threonine-protein kinase HipA